MGVAIDVVAAFSVNSDMLGGPLAELVGANYRALPEPAPIKNQP